MKNSFFKTLLASTLGTLIALVVMSFLSFIMFMSIISAMMSSSAEIVTVKDNSLLKVSFESPVVDYPSTNLADLINLSDFSVKNQTPLYNALKAIEKAKDDSRIKGIYMDLNTLGGSSMSAITELREALLDFKSSGKFIVSYADNYSQLSYYFASVSDKVYLNPYGSAMLQGMRSEVMFYKGLLDKIGVDMQIVRHGKFKSAVEPFMLDKMSPENREQMLVFINSVWNHILTGISESRGIEVAKLNQLADNLTLSTAQAALDNGLIDELMYKDDLVAKLCDLMQVSKEKNLNIVTFEKYISAPATAETKKSKTLSKNKVAVVYAMGEIAQGKGSEGIMSVTMGQTLRTIREDSTIKAVVFRVNSPGGDAQASEIVARELELIKQTRPVIISMGDMAASGGYWISTPSNVIVANPTTITGSIGVFGTILNVEKGMEQKLGLTVDVAKSNENSDFPSMYRPLKAREREVLQDMIEDIYGKFTKKVADSRDMTVEAVDEIGQGRIWSGVNAIDNKLVDRLGGLKLSIELAVSSADLGDDYRVVEYPKVKDPFTQFMESLASGKLKSQLTESELQHAMRRYEYLVNTIENSKGIQARMMYDIEVY